MDEKQKAALKRLKAVGRQERAWRKHPSVQGAEIVPLLSRTEDNADCTCLLTSLPDDIAVEKHAHDADEIIFVLQGQATMWLSGGRETQLSAGSFICVPRHVEHYPFRVSGDFLAYNVFTPPIR